MEAVAEIGAQKVAPHGFGNGARTNILPGCDKGCGNSQEKEATTVSAGHPNRLYHSSNPPRRA
jgi:hypothetical protein